MNDDTLRPDVVLFVCKPFQGQHILRAYCFDSGKLVHGIAGGSTCEMVSSYVIKSGKPTFTLDDTGGNAGLSLAPDELLLALPFRTTNSKQPSAICREYAGLRPCTDRSSFMNADRYHVQQNSFSKHIKPRVFVQGFIIHTEAC